MPREWKAKRVAKENTFMVKTETKTKYGTQNAKRVREQKNNICVHEVQ